MLQKNKMAQGPKVAHMRMSVHKVRGKYHIAHQTVLIMNLTALSIKSNMKLRLNENFFSCFPNISLCKACDPRDRAIFAQWVSFEQT